MPLNDRYTKHLVVSDSATVNPSQTPENVILVNSAGQKISTKTDAELNSRYAPANTFALIGDSITAANAQTGTTPSFARAANGWFWHANAGLGHAMTYSANYAVSGKRADEVLSEQVPQVLAMSPLPKYCIVHCGTNDLTASATAATIKARLLAIYDALNAVGITVIATTILPRSSYIASIASINTYIKSLAGSRKQFEVCDWATLLCDSTGAPASGMLFDGLHPDHSGATVMGATLAATLTGRLQAVNVYPSVGDTANLIANPFQTGTSGTKGTGVTGNVATSWTLERGTGTPVVAGSKVARTDGIPGEWQQITATENAAGDYVNYYTSVTVTGFAVGDRLVATMELDADSASAYPHLWLQFNSVQTGGSAGGGMSHFSAAAGYSYNQWKRLPRPGVIQSQPWAVPVGTSLPFTSMTLYLRVLALTGSPIRIGRVGFYNLGA